MYSHTYTHIYMHIYTWREGGKEGRQEGKRELERDRGRYSLRNWLSQLWRLTRSKSAGWVGSLETQGRVSVAVQMQRLSVGRIPSSFEEGGLLFYAGHQLIS